MSLQIASRITAVLSLSLALGACGGGGGSSTPSAAPTASVSGVASKGPINGGIVKIYALTEAGAKGSLLGSTTTNAAGIYQVDLTNFTGNVIVEVTGGTYSDESTGVTTSNPGLSAALSGVTGSVSLAVTPFTDIAVKSAGTALTKDNIDKANSLVSSMIGVNITSTKPVNPAEAGATTNATQDQIEYGLMLAAISRMVKDGNAANVSEAITSIKNDLADGKLDATGAMVQTALANFIGDPTYNKSGISSVSETMIDDSIQYITDNTITPQPSNTDLTKAKAMVADLRNTVLSIYNYKGVGAAGVVETPFKNLARDVETDIKPVLTAAISRVGAVLQAASSARSDASAKTLAKTSQLATSQTITVNDVTVTITFVDPKTYSFSATDSQGAVVGSGTLTIDDPISPTSGALSATFVTPSGNLVLNASFAATFSTQGALTSAILTGSATAPKFSFDFSQSGRKLSAVFAQVPSSSDASDIYPTSIQGSGLITTATAQISGSIDISAIVYNTSASLPMPKTATIIGSFEELAQGTLTGVKFTGTITGTWNNADTYDFDLGATEANFPSWNASFTGKIVAPSRPTTEAFLKVTQSAYKTFALEVKYQRTNTDSSVIFISGTGTLDETSKVLTASLTNQDGLIITLNFDQSKDPAFSGTISSSGATKQADLSLLQGIPSVKYIDNYFETLI